MRDLLGFTRKTLIGVWPDLIAADEAEERIAQTVSRCPLLPAEPIPA